MGYDIQGFIAERGTFDRFKKLGDRVSVVHLTDALDLLIQDDYLINAMDIKNFEKLEGFEHWFLDKTQMQIFETLSQTTPIIFFDATYVGGTGYQKALVWKDGNIVLTKKTELGGIPDSFGPINEALKTIGVVAENGKDEFETATLNRHGEKSILV